MEAVFIGILVIGVLGAVAVGSILGIVAFTRSRPRTVVSLDGLNERIEFLERATASLTRRVRVLEAPDSPPLARVEQPVAPTPQEPAQPAAAPAPPVVEAAPPVHTTTTTPAPVVAEVESGWKGFEEAVGKRWITWAGALALFFGAAFFVKYAFDNQWLGPTARVVMGIVFGVALLVAGDRFVRRQWRPLGLTLTGAGLAVLYVTVFTAFSIYHLVPQWAAFLSLVVITVAGTALALLHDAVTVSFLSVLGGFLTPVMVSTGVDARDGLFAYLTLLDLGVMAIALSKRWRSLDALAFVGTWVLYAGWHSEFYSESAAVPALAWLGVFYLVFLVLPFAWHLRHAAPVTVERFLVAVANAAVAFAYAWRMLHVDNQAVLGFVAVGMSACYVALGALARRRLPADARSLFGFITLAVTFLTMAVPLHLGLHGITLAWSLEAPVLLYLGYRFSYFPLRLGSAAILVLAWIRLFAAHWPLHHDPFTPVFNASFGSAVAVAAAGGAFAFVHHRFRGTAARREDVLVKILAAIASGVLAVFLADAEAVAWLRDQSMVRLALCAPVAVWTAGALCFLAAGVALKSFPARLAGVGLLVAAATAAARTYLGDHGRSDLIVANARFLAGAFGVCAFFAYALVIRRLGTGSDTPEHALPPALAGAGAVFLLLLLSAEAWSHFAGAAGDRERAGWTAQTALTIVWASYAALCLAVGFWKRVRPLRLAALGLFGLAALKLLAVDMATVRQVFRIVSFIVTGVLMIGASYLYHRLEVWLAHSSDGTT